MLGMDISSNINVLVSEMKGMGAGFGAGVDKAVGEAAKTFLKDCIVEIDSLIYSQTGSPYYHRTKNLRRSHKIRRITSGVWLVFSDKSVAAYGNIVHDGWKNSKGGSMPSRPWMSNAARKNKKKYKQIIADGLKGFFK